MVSPFRREDPVLHFGPRSSGRYSVRHYLLWPTWLYRVVAPELRDRQLNVLQKAVLGMCRAGVTNKQRIGERLRIHTDLAAQICHELQRSRLLDIHDLPTQEGVHVFEEETLTSHKMVTGHVFQDPWKGELWPRFFQRIDHAELVMKASGFPDLVFGTTGKPRRERAFMHVPTEVPAPITPEPRDILAATRRHRQALRGSEALDMGDDENQDRQLRETGVLVDRISLVDERPHPVFVVTYVYLPETNEPDGDWHVCDPFGMGASPRLRRDIERMFSQSSGLRGVVEQMLGKSLEAQRTDQLRWAAELRANATLKLEARLTVDARMLPHYNDLVDLECVHVEVDLLAESCPAHKLRDLLGAARRILEATFRAIADTHAPGDVWRVVYANGRPNEDRQFVASVYEASARAVGFMTPLPAALAGVTPNQVKAACYRDGWRLRGAILAAVLVARNDTMHPLNRAAREEPRLLTILEEILQAAGEAVHAGDRALSLKAVLPVIEQVHRVVALLSGMAHRSNATPVARK